MPNNTNYLDKYDFRPEVWQNQQIMLLSQFTKT